MRSATTMARASRVIRSSLTAFFQGYHCFSSVAALLAFPFSAAVLATEALTSPSFLHVIASRIRSMFRAAGFPPSAFFSLLNVKLSQTVFTFVVTLPFTLSFLLLAKACIIGIFREPSPRGRQLALPPCSKVVGVYPSLVVTHVFNSFVILSSNAATFSILFLLFNAVDLLGLTSHASLLALSAAGAIVYSVAIGIATVICNLAIIVSAMEHCSGYAAVLKACVLIKNRVSTALALALPTNLGMAAAEALFQLRVVGQYRRAGWLTPAVIGEAFSIAYIHALCVVLEIIVSCMFFRSCKTAQSSEAAEWRELEPEEKGDLEA